MLFRTEIPLEHIFPARPGVSGEFAALRKAEDAKKTFGKCLFPGLAALACLTHSERALAQLSQCAWPIEFSPEGYGNVVAPDDQARYWFVPFDIGYDMMKIEGAYPNARYFSFVVCNDDANGRPISIAGHKYDAIITPNARSPLERSSPAASSNPAAADRTYPGSCSEGWRI